MHKLNTSQIIALGFAGVIFVGGLILWLPFCSAPGQAVTFPDAVFTAATSVCVTGLSRGLTPQLNVAGKWIVILTMYLGRIGPLTLGTAVVAKVRNMPGSTTHLGEEDIMIG